MQIIWNTTQPFHGHSNKEKLGQVKPEVILMKSMNCG